MEKFLNSKQREIIDFTKSLVQIKSVNGNETEVAELIKDKLKEYRIKSRFYGKRKDRMGLLSEIGSKKGKTLLLCGHLDTVPSGDRKKWKHEPFSGKIVGNKMYGRGTLDMKGGLASMVFSMIAARESNENINGTIKAIMTYDEESGSHAGIKKILNGLKADACLVAEPLKDRSVRVGSRGIYRFKLKAMGKTAHTGNLEGKGTNANLGMAKILVALDEMKPTYKKHNTFPPPKVNAGTVIEGGHTINIFPDVCKSLNDIRLSYGQNRDTIRRDVKKVIEKEALKTKGLRVKMEELGYTPYFLTSQEEDIVKISVNAVNRILGSRKKTVIGGGATDGNIISVKGIPTVIVGPDGGNMHAENEFVYTKSILNTSKIYIDIISSYLK